MAKELISFEDVAMILLSKPPLRYGAFYFSFMMCGAIADPTWDELVPMAFD